MNMKLVNESGIPNFPLTEVETCDLSRWGSKRVAVRFERAQLYNLNNTTHEWILWMFSDNEHRLFQTIARLASLLAARGPRHQFSPARDLDQIKRAVGYLIYDLQSNGSMDGMVLDNVERIHEHLLGCAQNLARFLPNGSWEEIDVLRVESTHIVFTGVYSASDYAY